MNLKSFLKNIFFYPIEIGVTPIYKMLISIIFKSIVWIVFIYMVSAFSNKLNYFSISMLGFPLILFACSVFTLLSHKETYFRFNVKSSSGNIGLIFLVLLMKTFIMYMILLGISNSMSYEWIYPLFYRYYISPSFFNIFAFNKYYIAFYYLVLWVVSLGSLIVMAYIAHLIKIKDFYKGSVILSLSLFFLGLLLLGYPDYKYEALIIPSILLFISVVMFAGVYIHYRAINQLHKIVTPIKLFALPICIYAFHILIEIPEHNKFDECSTQLRDIVHHYHYESSDADKDYDYWGVFNIYKDGKVELAYPIRTSLNLYDLDRETVDNETYNNLLSTCQRTLSLNHPYVNISYGILRFLKVKADIERETEEKQKENVFPTQAQKTEIKEALQYIDTVTNYDNISRRDDVKTYDISYRGFNFIKDKDPSIIFAYDMSRKIIEQIFSDGQFVERREAESSREKICDKSGDQPSCYYNMAKNVKDKNISEYIFYLLKLAEKSDSDINYVSDEFRYLPTEYGDLGKLVNKARYLATFDTKQEKKAYIYYLLGTYYEKDLWSITLSFAFRNDIPTARYYFKKAKDLGSKEAENSLAELDRIKAERYVDFEPSNRWGKAETK